jgi:hypothetical protein
MPYLTKYHIGQHSAPVLLNPIAASLRELEQRTAHYATRLNLDPGADTTLTAAAQAIARARSEIERLMGAGAAS